MKNNHHTENCEFLPLLARPLCGGRRAWLFGTMGIYSSPPPARSFHDDKATLLVCWWCTIFAAVVILFRVCGRYIRTERLFKEDWLAFACLIPLLGRMAVVHVILLFGTNNTVTTGLTDEQIHRRAIGSRLVLVSRIFYAATWVLP